MKRLLIVFAILLIGGVARADDFESHVSLTLEKCKTYVVSQQSEQTIVKYVPVTRMVTVSQAVPQAPQMRAAPRAAPMMRTAPAMRMAMSAPRMAASGGCST